MVTVTAAAAEWNQWGGSPARNNTPEATNLPVEWEPGEFDFDSGAWKPETSRTCSGWRRSGASPTATRSLPAARCSSAPTTARAGWARYPANVDLGCLLAFSAADGSFLWQDSSEKLPTGRVHDWPLQGICCAPLVEGDRLWYVTSRGEVKCLDTEGFRDGENDGPFTAEKIQAEDEADVVWVLDMMEELRFTAQHVLV